MKQEVLIQMAQDALGSAYAPYSEFPVGAALETESGKVFSGCNIENVSYGAGVCAERVAIFNALSSGEKKFKRMAIVSAKKSELLPCGICRQVLWELAGDLEVLVVRDGGVESYRLSELYPKPFSFSKTNL